MTTGFRGTRVKHSILKRLKKLVRLKALGMRPANERPRMVPKRTLVQPQPKRRVQLEILRCSWTLRSTTGTLGGSLSNFAQTLYPKLQVSTLLQFHNEKNNGKIRKLH
jgi:hypothetical protein